MDMKSDITLKGPIWAETLDQLRNTVFETYWDIYALCVSIGMMYDAQIDSDDMVPEGYDEEPKNIPRSILNQAKNRALIEFMVQAALVTTKHLDLSEDERLETAFEPNAAATFKPIPFLTKFANYGITKLHEVVYDTEGVETLESLMVYLNSTFEAGVDTMKETLEDLDDSDLE